MLDQAEFFLDASNELVSLFGKGFVGRRLNVGETLFDQNDYGDAMYVLDEGLLEVSILSISGRKLSLNRLRPGSVFGEISIFDPGPRTARIEAIEPCRLRVIRQSALLSEVALKPHLAEDLLRLAGKRLRWMSQQMETQVFLSPTARLAAKVLYLAGDSRKIQMSQAQLADFVGVTREVVSKTLSEWRREGFVALSRGYIEISDKDALENIKNSELF